MDNFNANISLDADSNSASNSLLALPSFSEIKSLGDIGTSNLALEQSNDNVLLCSRCKKTDSVHQSLFNTERENMRSYLRSETEGVLILSALEYHRQSPIPESMICAIVRLLINRELAIILRREQDTRQDPLKHFE